MDERLAPLCLLPPATATPWNGFDWNATTSAIARRGGEAVAIELPLFWYAPDWYRVPPELAAALAWAVGQLGVTVSALRSELAGPGTEPRLQQESLPSTDRPMVRMVPYRPERYGFGVRDFDDAGVIDVRLALARDAFGRFAFPPAQIQRWEATPAEDPLAGGGWLPSATFPPDVVSLDHLQTKLDQLRSLAPTAAVFVSIAPVRLDDELPRILAAQPDGLILRLDQFHVEGLSLASLTRRARRLLVRLGAGELPLWIVPGPLAPTDAVKLIELGASAIAIDAWCNAVRDHALQIQPPSNFSYTVPGGSFLEKVQAFVQQQLIVPIETFRGLSLSVKQVSAGERLGSFSGNWSKTLGVRPLG